MAVQCPLTEETDIDSIELMECIRNYKAIYGKTCKDYEMPQKKNNAWKEVCSKLGIESINSVGV